MSPCCSRARAAPERTCSRRRSMLGARAAVGRSSPSRARRWRSICSKASCSGTSKARSLAHGKTNPAASRPPRAARCFSMKSATCRSICRSSCCVFWKSIAATNRDLEADVRAGRFREDLFFRLNVIGIRLPALRERMEDLPQLIDHLLLVLSARHRRGSIQLAPDARAALASYDWPGNIRELVNALERAVVLSRGDTMRAEHLPDRLLAPLRQSSPAASEVSLSLDELERRHIQQVLAEAATLEDAAARLGINPTTLWRKRKRYGID